MNDLPMNGVSIIISLQWARHHMYMISQIFVLSTVAETGFFAIEEQFLFRFKTFFYDVFHLAATIPSSPLPV
jgi:hypothetical protein